MTSRFINYEAKLRGKVQNISFENELHLHEIVSMASHLASL